MRTVQRVEDMSPIGKLVLHVQDDGDIIVAVHEVGYDGLLQPGASVEFCCPGSGGGHSPRTHAALHELFKAMQADTDAKERQP
jgi:hypothetical protein